MTEHGKALGTLLERPPATPGTPATPRREVLRRPSSIRERTRVDNRDRYSRSPMPRSECEFRCECARPDCRVRLPLEVERHRRWRDRFIVGSAHADADTVVGVADHFLVVEAKRIKLSPPPSPAQATGDAPTFAAPERPALRFRR